MARVKRYKLDESPLYISRYFLPSGIEIRFYFSTKTNYARFMTQIDAYSEQVCGVLSRRYRNLELDGNLIAAFDLYSKIERAEQRIVIKNPLGTVRTLGRGSLVKMDCWYKGPYGEEV
jgi:hypothetical protein